MHARLENCPAPAKLNLFLHVTGRRADGYYMLESVFQLIDRCDRLHFHARTDGAIRRVNDILGVPQDMDLVVRAARLLQAESGRPNCGVDIVLDKLLPMGGGLGGGSSDAATTLIALNHLWQAGLSRAQLMALGLQLGADVPFFIFGRNAFARGVGELLEPVALAPRWYVVIEPGVSVPTPDIFRAPDLTRSTEPVRITDFPACLASFGRNDLEPVATRVFPQIRRAIDWLSTYVPARMTGSGACVFGAVEYEAEADAIVAEASGQWSIWKAQSLANHPLDALLGS